MIVLPSPEDAVLPVLTLSHSETYNAFVSVAKAYQDLPFASSNAASLHMMLTVPLVAVEFQTPLLEL